MNSDTEDDIMDPVMQCTTLPSHSGFSQKKLISFVTEIHMLSIDISLRDCLDDGVAASFQASKSNKESSIGEIVRLIITYVKQECNKYCACWSKEHKLIKESQIKMIQVKEMMLIHGSHNSKSKDKGSRSRSQSMNDQSHYKQDKTKTRQSINVKSHIFNVIGSTEEFEERDLNIGGDC
ncbi:hypothetical protein Tco_0997732 [Tanacetum coccineum]